ncbi:MAG: SusC/RagA family TonB-linked outer membrane protein [Flavobacteriaceae bacterium]|nr:SusC/RagA family TonB-linked outer membrane protein [Flavobacteriaceae bacterium]
MIQKVLKLLFVFCLFSFQNGQAQTTVKGTITDGSSGIPLSGANIIVKGTSNGVTSDFDGNYSINVSDQNATLVFSYVGYTTKEVSVNNQSTINVSLAEDASQLDEVVVTALGIKKSTKALGYSLTEVKGEEISTVKTTNAVNSLQGKIAGVSITQNATGAAGSSRVIIRGNSSLTGNNQPLYIVDGVPIGNENNGSAGMWGGSDGGDGISSLNPDDIASISVLKGGAASALYGSRAANGVILVTTKSGKGQNGFGVELSSSVTFDKVDSSLTDYQTEYGQGIQGRKPANVDEARDNGLSSWGARLDGSSVVQWDGVSRPYSYVGNNLDHFYRTGTTFINTLALTSGTDKMNYRFSASDLTNEDVMPNAGLNRKSFGLNSSAILADKLTTTANIKYIVENVQNRPRLSDAPGNANFTVASLPANVDVRTMNPGANEDLTERTYSTNTYSQNPYFAAYNFRNEDTKNRIIANSSLRYDINDWLYTSVRAGVDHSTIRRTSVEPYGTAYKPLGGINENEIRYTQIDADVMIGAEKDITDKLSAVAFFGANSNSIKTEQLDLGGNDFIVPGLEDIGNTITQSRGRSFGERKIGSLYGSLELAYNKWAYITFTGRNDWFSTLSAPGKTTPNDDFYPSVNTSLILSEVIEMPDFVNFLKLRGGYSEVAGGAQDPYALSLTYQIFGNPVNGQPLGSVNGGTVPNANLVPFSKEETEVGIDARLFNNRLSIDLAYYKNTTTNDIVDVSTSVFSSYNGAKANLGKIENKGFEFLLGFTPIQTDNFKWSASFNGANNSGKILATNETNSNVNLDEPRSQNVRITHIVGEAYGTIVGVSYERDASGNIVYEINGDGVPLAVQGERKILGKGVAPLTLGLSNTFRYKDLSLSFLIDGKFGGQMFSGTNSGAYGRGLHKATLDGRENGLVVSGIDKATGSAFTTTVDPENLSTYYGRISGIAEEFVEDADYIKLRQLSIGYTLPERYLKNIFLSSVDISFIASNLFYLKRSIDNIDPESGYNVGNSQGLEYFGVPSARSYGFNLNIKF